MHSQRLDKPDDLGTDGTPASVVILLGNPNGARALRGKQTGNADAMEAIKAKAQGRAENLRAIIADVTAQGVAGVRAIAAELNGRGILSLSDCWSGLRRSTCLAF